MKGLAGAATIIALGLPAGTCGMSAGAGGGSAVGETVENGAGRTLKTTDHKADDVDDALGPLGGPSDRAKYILEQRQDWAEIEYQASKGTQHFSNGDRSSEGSFHKTLPHDEFGVVDPAAFDALVDCINAGTIDECEKVPAGDSNGFLANPVAAIATDMAGPAGSALTIPPAPTVGSEDLAAQLAEVYWMALTRDVPFSKYGTDEATVAAADNLAAMPGFKNMNGVAVDSSGRADPEQQLFRSRAVGVEVGPMVSQLLVSDVTIDSISITPMQTTYAPNVDYMTDYDDWLSVQNGGGDPAKELDDEEKRYIRNARDLSRLVATDTIYTEAFRGALVLLAQGAINAPGANGPYVNTDRQKGFVNYGVSHLMKILGSAELAQRSSWFQKWNVHLFARPESVGGTLHNVINGNLNVAFDTSIIDNRELLDRVAARNDEMNNSRGGNTYLLSQATRRGGPSHPTYPAGHAVQNGAFATVLKALVGIERATDCFSNPVYPDDDGLELLPFRGTCLTFEGEINKLAVNVAFGRQMCGVHYRMDSEEGLLLGEMVGVRMLQQEIMGFAENAGHEFRLFNGETIRLEPNGDFFVDDYQCSGYAFEGVDKC